MIAPFTMQQCVNSWSPRPTKGDGIKLRTLVPLQWWGDGTWFITAFTKMIHNLSPSPSSHNLLWLTSWQPPTPPQQLGHPPLLVVSDSNVLFGELVQLNAIVLTLPVLLHWILICRWSQALVWGCTSCTPMGCLCKERQYAIVQVLEKLSSLSSPSGSELHVHITPLSRSSTSAFCLLFAS